MIEIREMTWREAAPLRTKILRPGYPPGELATYDADAAPHTLHVGALQGERVVGVATFLVDPWPGAPEVPAVRLRGMAVEAGLRGQGVGADIMVFALERLPALRPECDWLWCNARIRARSFYERLGLEGVGEVFEIDGIGPHVRMRRRLTGR